MTSQTDLAVGRAPAQQDFRAKFESTGTPQRLQGGTRDRLGLIEASLGPLTGMQRNRNYDNGANGHDLLEIRNRFGKHAPELGSGRTNRPELQHMNQVAQSRVVSAVGDRTLKGGTGTLTKHATRRPKLGLSALDKGLQVQGFAASRAIRSVQGADSIETGLTDGKAGKTNQRGVTETAI